jgi:hypothetical protein
VIIEVEDGVPMPESQRQKTLNLARTIYANNKVGKSTAAKMAISEIGFWPSVELTSAIDYLRNNIIEK